MTFKKKRSVSDAVYFINKGSMKKMYWCALSSHVGKVRLEG